MIADGINVRTVASLVGHADPSLTVRTYAHPVAEAARRAANRMAVPASDFVDAEAKSGRI